MKDVFDHLLEKHRKLAEQKDKSDASAKDDPHAGLSRAGYKEAHDAARRTAASFSSIHSSPMKRARDTAYIIARSNPQSGHIKVAQSLLPSADSAPLLAHVRHQLDNLHADSHPVNVTHKHVLQRLHEVLGNTTDRQSSTASLHRLDPETKQISRADKTDKPGVYFLRHAEVQKTKKAE